MKKNPQRDILILVLIVVAITILALVTMPDDRKPAGIVPSREVLETKYFHDISETEREHAPDISGIYAEYALVTVDPAAFMHDADADRAIILMLPGTLFQKEAQYRLLLTEERPSIDPDAVLVIKNESGEFVEDLPLIRQFRGSVIGKHSGEALLTVSDNVILGTITINGVKYVLDQQGPGLADNGKPIHFLYRSDRTIPYTGPPQEFDVHVPAGYPIMNRDYNASHSVTVALMNATHTVGEEDCELVAGGYVSPRILMGLENGTYSVRFITDRNTTSNLELSVPSGPGFLLHPNGTVTRDT